MSITRLIFHDGVEIGLRPLPGQTVLEAAMEADAPLRYDCCSGSCGSCVVRRVQGTTELRPSETLPLSAEELAAGLIPACLALPTSDLCLRLPYPSSPAPSAPARHRATLRRHTRLGASVSQLELELDEASAEAFRFQPGQYIRVRPPGMREARAYSIAGTPDELPRLELLVRHVPGGQVTRWLRESAAPGQRIALHGPLGAFALDAGARRHVFVAGGTGLAPILSMIRTLRDSGGGPALLCFGCTHGADLFYRRELEALRAGMPGLEVRVCADDGAGAPDVRGGSAVSALADADLAQGTAAYLCGPPGMVEAARRRLREAGLDEAAIRAERFSPSA